MEIGGYIQLDDYSLPMLHSDAVKLNCGRNCLAYVIKSKKINKLHIPYFICDSVIDLCKREGIDFDFYHIGYDLLPTDINCGANDWVYIVNYYGQLSQDLLKSLKSKYTNVIVDNTQAYFDMPLDGVDTIYTCRKYFGVADGAILYTDKMLGDDLQEDISYQRMTFLLGRYEKGANEFYSDYVANNKLFATEPIKKMSKLTENLLHAIDYNAVKQKRSENFAFYFDKLQKYNFLSLRCVEGAFAYPFYSEKADLIRKQLIQNEIYIPTLWPNVAEITQSHWAENKLAQNILPLTVDQRYSPYDLQKVVDIILQELES